MVIKTYLDKVNTIIKDSAINTGLNPISELIYGLKTTRLLLYFDVNNIKDSFVKNGVTDKSYVKHILKMKNCGMVSDNLYKMTDKFDTNGVKLRTSSFDLIFFLIPQVWDEGKGFDYEFTFFNQGVLKDKYTSFAVDSSKLIVTDGCNWYQGRNGCLWDEEGIYSNDTLSKEYDNFSSKDGSTVIIARQHFDKGIEDINVDITDTVNKFISGELKNYGIGIAFTPMTELTESDDENYVGFFTNHTNTFFEPYLETTYDDTILDDRNNFILDKKNRLYLYSNIGGFLTNLDELPRCTINDEVMDVHQAAEGIYYVEVFFSSKDYSPNVMFYDVWDNIKYDGVQLDAVELDFVTKASQHFFQIGNNIGKCESHKPILYGIKYDETILRGDKRKVVVISKEEYKRNHNKVLDKLEYRLYVKDGEQEITVIDYQPINRALNENYFIIDTKILVPQQYYVEVKYNENMEEKRYLNVLSFKVVNHII
jgi:hypothetical protein